jgi:hypothetical protein
VWTADTLTLLKDRQGTGMGLSNEGSMVGTITAWNQVRNTKRIIQMNEYFARSFHDGIHRFHGHEHKVQGQLPLLQCITFHSLLVFEEVVVFKIYLAKHYKSMTRENFRVHTD